jgi:myo-inositol 2-dehydrogenase/D-chiro-inositol 1-dehydrogenase
LIVDFLNVGDGDAVLLREQREGMPDFVALVDAGRPHIEFVPGSLRRDAIAHLMKARVDHIDLARWFLGSDPVSVTAIGSSFGYPAFAEIGDCEAGVALYKHENGAMAVIHVGRTAAHGYHIETEITGTRGALRIGGIPRKNQCEIYGADGVLIECPEYFPERFDDAYRLEMQAFVNAVRENRKPDITVYDGTACTKIGFATTEAFKTGQLIKI